MQNPILITSLLIYFPLIFSLIVFRHRFSKRTKRIGAFIALVLSGVIGSLVPILDGMSAIPVGITFVICILILDSYTREPKKVEEIKEFVSTDPLRRKGPFETFEGAKRLLRWMHDNGQFGDKPFPSDDVLRKMWNEGQELKKQAKKDALSDL